MLNRTDLERIHYNLDLPQKNSGGTSILVLAARSGEGCTSVVGGLACELSRSSWQDVLIIDANLRKPALHKMFKVEKANGLSDLLAGKTDISSAIKDTDIENLKILTSGSEKHNGASLFPQDQLINLLKAAIARFSIVLLDISPFMEYPDAVVLAPHVDGVIQVIQACKTRRQVAQEVLKQLVQINSNVLGTILNRSKREIPDWLYRRL